MKTTLLLALLLVCAGTAAAEDSVATGRAAWILNQAEVQSFGDAAPQPRSAGRSAAATDTIRAPARTCSSP